MKKLVYILNGKTIETIITGPSALVFWMKKQKAQTGQYRAGRLKVINV
jgi:hypothetical protein